MRFSSQFVQAVGDGIREYNMRQPAPVVVRMDGTGRMIPPTPEEKAVHDREWLNAVYHGLKMAAAECAP